MDPSYFIVAAILTSLVLGQVNQRLASPKLAIADRWLRWFVFAFAGAHVCRDFELIERPYWALVTLFFLLWFLAETTYNWLAIAAHSSSPLPLFPRYSINQSGEEWPVQPRILKLRDWLRAQGFKQVQALKTETGGGIYVRASVYQDAAATTRVQITFLPQGNGSIAVCCSLMSLTTDGCRYVTDNSYLPFAGFYPETWFVERRPWKRSLPRLLARHKARVASQALAPFELMPLADLNAAQSELDRVNTELGFLHPHAERDDFGQITHEGRYRVWKEIWLLNYFGRSARYE